MIKKKLLCSALSLALLISGCGSAASSTTAVERNMPAAAAEVLRQAKMRHRQAKKRRLRRQKKQRKPSIKAQNRRKRMLNKPSIHERSTVIEKRQRTGDFEGDTIIGHDHKGIVVSQTTLKLKCVGSPCRIIYTVFYTPPVSLLNLV